MWSLLYFFLAFIFHAIAALEAGCFATDSALAANCTGRVTKWQCLKYTGYVSPSFNKTCEWREVGTNGAVTVDANYFAMKTGVFDPGHPFDGYCQMEISMHINSKARGRWTMHAAVLAGPGRSSEPGDATFVKASRDGPTAGCSTGTTCGAVVGAPVGGAAASGATYDLAFTLFAIDNLIKDTQDQFIFKFKARRVLSKCGAGKATLLVSEKVDFGPTEFLVQQGLPGNRRYFLQSYRAYKISGVRGARWNVRVSKNLGSSVAKTPMVVLLMREEDYKKWKNSCTTICAPPIAQALPGTISTATSAKGRASGLNPAGAYRLVVAYPRVHHDSWENTFWYVPIDFNEFNKQQVAVEVWAA